MGTEQVQVDGQSEQRRGQCIERSSLTAQACAGSTASNGLSAGAVNGSV